MPSVGNVHVVLTATRQAMTDLGRAVHVDLFTETEAVAYLATRTGLHDEEGARKLAAAVGHLPLALAQAAAVVGARRPAPDVPGLPGPADPGARGRAPAPRAR